MCREAWPLDGVKFETLKEQLAKRKPEDVEVDYGILYVSATLLCFTNFSENLHDEYDYFSWIY